MADEKPDPYEACPGYKKAKDMDAEETKLLGRPNPLNFVTGHLLHCEGVCARLMRLPSNDCTF